VQRNGAPYKAVDFNFWGVTFEADGDHFFVTLGTRIARFLVRASVDERRGIIQRDDVECPSLSPNGRSLVFKKAAPLGVGWRLYHLDLATGAEHPLNQVIPSVDDQVDWLDNEHVVYQVEGPQGTGVWVLPTDGVAPARLWLRDAYSPAVQR